MISSLFSKIIVLVFGALYPAYASFKAVNTRDIKEYSKWMMYWILFALFICIETVADVLINWIPLYYELKLVAVFWALPSISNGSAFLYRAFLHPLLREKEEEIDGLLVKAKEKSYVELVHLGLRALSVLMKAIFKHFDLSISIPLKESVQENDEPDGVDVKAARFPITSIKAKAKPVKIVPPKPN